MAFAALAVLYAGCGSDASSSAAGSAATVAPAATAPDPKGIGEIRNVHVEESIDEAMSNRGKGIYDMKCSACHLTTDKRVVGPGFSGITNRRAPEWIMNMITNTDVMLDEDPTAQKLLEECLTRMPNQNVSIGDARDLLEFLRQNDVATAGSKDGALVK